ncbi:MAG: PD40 domain-containing protein [Acidobacteria bacterium]|nr:PD40 domain-containing protein [Acidobacteriota bacterium]
MSKWLISLLYTLFIFNIPIPIFAQQSNRTPVVYRAINQGVNPQTAGRLSIIDALSNITIGEINLPGPGDNIQLSRDKTKAFVTQPLPGFSQRNFGLFVIDLQQNTVRTILSTKAVFNIALAPDGLIWAMLARDNMVVVIDPQTLITVNTININLPLDIAFSPDGTIAYISSDGFISVYEIQNRRETTRINNLPINKFLPSMSMDVSPDGKLLAFGVNNDTNKGVILIDTASLQIIDTVAYTSSDTISLTGVKFNLDNTLYFAELSGVDLYKYSLNSKALTKIFTANIFTIQAFDISPDGNLIYITDFAGRSIIDLKTDTAIFQILEFNTNVQNCSGIELAGNFTIGQPPNIQVTSPTANQQLMPGQSFRIEWQTTVAAQSFSIASHKVELSTDGGQTFTVIPGAEQLRADARDFNWTVPNIQVANKAQIRVSTVDLGAKRANSITGNFTIGMGGSGNNDTQAPTVNFIAPMGGENFNGGSNLAISWMSNDNVGVVAQDLFLSTDGGMTFTTTLATGLSGSTQSFNFAIPQTLETNQARLRLIVRDAAGNSSQAITANNFRIQSAVDNLAPTVTISQPTSNQQVMAGQPIQVNWQSTDNRAVMSQALLLSLDGGQNFTQVASFGVTDSSFTLNNIAGLSLTTPQAIVRITATDTAGNTGQATAQFTINPTITQASFQAKILTINGIGFMSNGANNLQLFINDKLITIAPRSVTNTTFTIKGNKKKLNLIKGSSNSVRLVVDGLSSNMGSFNF